VAPVISRAVVLLLNHANTVTPYNVRERRELKAHNGKRAVGERGNSLLKMTARAAPEVPAAALVDTAWGRPER
jgi:hypothetical protein